MKRIETIKNALVSKMSGVSHLRHVYSYNTASPEGYPFATIAFDTGTGEFADFSAISKRNLRHDVFSIRVFVERDEASFGPEKAERVSTETLDEILTAFDMDCTLSGTVKAVTPVSWSGDFEIMGNITRVAEVLVDCLDLVDAK